MSASDHVLFLYFTDKHTDNVLDDFPKISNHFLKISEDSPKIVRRAHEHFRILSKNVQRLDNRRFAEDFRGIPQDVLIIYQRSDTNKYKNSLTVKLDISEVINIFTKGDMENLPP